VTNDRDDRDREAPVIKVTDKRRFASIASEEGPAEPAGPATGVGAGEEGSAEAAEPSDELAKARAEAQEYLGHLQRLQAEFDNYRKRVLREQTAAVELAAEPVVRRLLEVLDDFELALMAAEAEPDLETFLKGVELVYAKLFDALKAEGLERIPAEGAVFDPELHEALMQTGDGDGDPHVAEVFRAGYTLRGRVIRPAGVRVERA
jgi:molecular chaperone GrpE